MSSFSHPNHTDFYTGSSSSSGGGHCYPNSDGYYQPPPPYTSYASYVQPPPPQYSHVQPSPQEIPYAVPVNAAPMSSRDSIDYSRPQTWRNMPQQQDRGSNASTASGLPPSFRSDSMNRSGRSSSNVSATSLDSSTQPATYSEAAMAANASVAAAAVNPGESLFGGKTSANPGENLFGERASVSSATSSATRSSVDAAVDTMWEARRAREKAEEEADQKLIDAVCKASLAEFNERERALKMYESETSQRSLEHQASSATLHQAKTDAEQRKRAAMQTVLDSKVRAKEMSEKAREATALYEQKNSERLAKQAELEALKLRDAQEAELLTVQKRKDEAMRKRTEAEQKAREAREKAEAMRRQAFQAASKVRANSRRQIETQLSEEEALRQRERQRKLDEIEKNKELARQRKEEAAKKAEDARRRAEELRLKAEQARAGLNSSTSTTPTASA
ncbi:hypothetical protein F444_14568 [Phytophthora nicotianae P1976]|uniref:Uncharacterized protein n=1 Tax=Phytophthora nicotianae P1976 TaxID=1317066 RepID=A0A080ZPT2_PHYNI|nr:hypothetical protein F444_14568 [Phytophthora nicotianae P1976]